MSEVLKSCGIHSHHKQFRSFLQQLFKVCSKQWLQTSSTEIKTSTSEAMRALVMKHKSTVLKLKLISPKKSTPNKDNLESKRKCIADVKKVLFTETTPNSDLESKNNNLDLKMKNSPIKQVINENTKDISVFIDIKKTSSSNDIKDQLNKSFSSTSDNCPNIDNDSKDSEAIFAL